MGTQKCSLLLSGLVLLLLASSVQPLQFSHY